MPKPPSSPAQQVLKRLRQSTLSIITGLSSGERKQVAEGLRKLAEEVESGAKERAKRHEELTSLHMSKLVEVKDFLRGIEVESSIIQAFEQMPVLVAGGLKISYDDETWKFHAQLGERHDSAFSYQALCLDMLEYQSPIPSPKGTP